ncbi:MAG: hypothetical protein ACLTYN_02515 [Dysosmobacter welbionis]
MVDDSIPAGAKLLRASREQADTVAALQFPALFGPPIAPLPRNRLTFPPLATFRLFPLDLPHHQSADWCVRQGARVRDFRQAHVLPKMIEIFRSPTATNWENQRFPLNPFPL